MAQSHAQVLSQVDDHGQVLSQVDDHGQMMVEELLVHRLLLADQINRMTRIKV